MTAFTMTIFNDLTKQFPTSEALFAYLKSPEGGSLVVRNESMSPEDPLVMIRYSKETSDMTVPHVSAFRSVVWDARSNRPVSVSPARGLAFSTLPADATGFTVEEFVDGVMINLFHYNGAWRLATRSNLDAECNFYGTRTFAQLFWETFNGAGLLEAHLDPRCVYSWVLQHPEERIVVAPAYGIPKLRLVELYQIDGGTVHALDIHALTGMPPPLKACVVDTHPLVTVEDVKERVTAWGKRYGADWQGLVVKTADGQRYKLRSNEYDEARHLRGNQAKRPYVWLERWSEGRLGAYLRLYKEEDADAWATVNAFKNLTQEVYDLYQCVYRRKELRLGDAPQKYRKLLWDAHAANAGAYFPALREFMNKQDTARKLWLVNYERRYATGMPTHDPQPDTA